MISLCYDFLRLGSSEAFIYLVICLPDQKTLLFYQINRFLLDYIIMEDGDYENEE